MGRVMRPFKGKEYGVWLCLAKGSRVLTDKGLVAIDKVKLTHKIWDGTNFVTHGGAVCNGIQETITYQGLTATAGHLVHTAEGWRTFGDCAREQIRITQTGFGGSAIRIGEDIRSTSFLVGRKAKTIYARFMRMCDMRLSQFNFPVQFAKWKNKRVSSLQPAGHFLSNVVVQPSAKYESALRQPFSQSLYGLRGEGSGVSIFRGKGSNIVDNAIAWFARICYSGPTISNSIGQNRPSWALRGWEFALAIRGVKSTKQARESECCPHTQIQVRSSGDSLFRQHFEAFLLGWNDGGANHRTLPQAIHKAEREVWDILDAGPHNRFTCEGLLVHNCHSGNYLRFRSDWDKLFTEGVTELEEGCLLYTSDAADE